MHTCILSLSIIYSNLPGNDKGETEGSDKRGLLDKESVVVRLGAFIGIIHRGKHNCCFLTTFRDLLLEILDWDRVPTINKLV